MDNELLNILANSNKDIDNQKLMDYLTGKSSAEECHDVEKEMADSEFINDAVEGLEQIKNKKDINIFLEDLNANLHKQLNKKKHRKQKRALKDLPWLYLTIILILCIIIICFIIIKKYLDNKSESHKILPTTEQK